MLNLILFNIADCLHFKGHYICHCAMLDILSTPDQGHSKVFTTGQARFNPERYVIKCMGG